MLRPVELFNLQPSLRVTRSGLVFGYGSVGLPEIKASVQILREALRKADSA